MSKILIVGNGFDLDLGLKTSYADFLQSDEFKTISHPHDGGNDIASHLKGIQSCKGWVDIEAELARFSAAAAKKLSRDTIKDDFIQLKKQLAVYLQRIQAQELKQDCAAFDLIRLGYLKKGAEGAGCYDRKLFTTIYTFNYTDSIVKTLNFLNLELKGDPILRNTMLVPENVNYYDAYQELPSPYNPNRVIHVHGSLANNNMIFGTEDSADLQDEHSFLFKSYHAYYRQSPDLSREIVKATEIQFFGCALGVTDTTRFKPIFDYLSQPSVEIKAKKKIVFNIRKSDYDAIYARIRALTSWRTAQFFHNCEVSFIDTATRQELPDHTDL